MSDCSAPWSSTFPRHPQTCGNLHQKPARISRLQSSTKPSTECYVVDGWDTSNPRAIGSENFDVVLDLEGSNAVTMRRVFGRGFDDLVAREDASGAVLRYGTDHLGSARTFFDSLGGVSNAVDYDAFGGILSGVHVDRYRWTGREADSLTGLRHHLAREYHPRIGRCGTEAFLVHDRREEVRSEWASRSCPFL